MRLALALASALLCSPALASEPSKPPPGLNVATRWAELRDALYPEGSTAYRKALLTQRAALDSRARAMTLSPEKPPTAARRRAACDTLLEALYLGHHGRARDLASTAPRVSEAIAQWQARCKLSDELAISLYRAFGLDTDPSPFFVTNHAPPRAVIAFSPRSPTLPTLPDPSDRHALRVALSLPQDRFVERETSKLAAEHSALRVATLTLMDPDRPGPDGAPTTVFQRSVHMTDEAGELRPTLIIDRYHCEETTPADRGSRRLVTRCGAVAYRYEAGLMTACTPDHRASPTPNGAP